jgi:diadenosine tetraphosphate (Ap4A) HIT family hydrolase
MPCPFCMIASGSPPSSDPPNISSPAGSAYLILSTPTVVAFLDIAPVAAGHLLLCPRTHRAKDIEMTGLESAAIGFWLPVLSKSVMRALFGGTNGSWNVMQANGKSFTLCLFTATNSLRVGGRTNSSSFSFSHNPKVRVELSKRYDRR